MIMSKILKGDIFYCDFGEDNIVGSEQRGKRPVLIIQNDIGNKFSPTVIVATITTRDKKGIPTHVELFNYPYLQPKCTVLLEQLKTVDKSRLREYITSVTPRDMTKVDEALAVSMGLNINTLAVC